MLHASTKRMAGGRKQERPCSEGCHVEAGKRMVREKSRRDKMGGVRGQQGHEARVPEEWVGTMVVPPPAAGHFPGASHGRHLRMWAREGSAPISGGATQRNQDEVRGTSSRMLIPSPEEEESFPEGWNAVHSK